MVSWKVVPSRTALLVIDINNSFAKTNVLYVPLAKKILPTLEKVISALGRMRMPIFYSTQVYSADDSDVGLAKVLSSSKYPPQTEVASEGTIGVCAELKPAKNDIMIKKHRYSCFYKTELKSTLVH